MEFHRRHEAATVGEEEVDVKDLMGLVNEIIPFHMKHIAEPEVERCRLTPVDPGWTEGVQ